MRKIFSTVAIALIVSSCAKQASEEKEQEQTPIMLSASFSAPDTTTATSSTATSSIKSKATATNSNKPSSTETKPQAATKATATAFEEGDQLGLFVVKAGQGVQHADNLVDNARMVVAADGVIKGDPTTVYYPESSVSIYSYYPYQSGDATADALGVQVGIRTDQTDFSSAKLSDLCFGSLLNTDPSKSAKAISFSHKFSQLRVEVSTYAGCPAVKQVRLLGIKDSALLNIEIGAVTLKSHVAEVLPNKRAENSYLAVIPAQVLNGACVAIDLVDGKTFIFNAISPISLTQSATNSLSLSINDKGVVSLKGDPSISPWTGISGSGVVSSAVENEISLYWLSPHADYATADKVTLTITDPLAVVREVDLVPTVDPKSSSEYAIYNLNLSLAGTTYPLTVSRVRIYKGATPIGNCSGTAIDGKVLYKAGVHKVGMRTNCILINGIWWATGNLVANGANSCKVGEPGDGGLYFQYGGLIGYKGGATGDGVGVIDAAKYPNGTYWGGATAYSANDVAVAPAGYANKGKWPYFDGYASGGFGYYYFSNFTAKYADFQSQANANNPALGIGDPCAYYLGSPWRLPTIIEASLITDNSTENAWVPWTTASIAGRWEKTNGPKSAIGAWFGPNARSGNPTVNTDLFIPASGYRYTKGEINAIDINGYLWSSSVYNATQGVFLVISKSLGVCPRHSYHRVTSCPIRCVSN